MWETSNSPAAVRTAMCSAVMPEYSTGISQPPNGTIRAPRATCDACRGVFLSRSEADSVIKKGFTSIEVNPRKVLCATAAVKRTDGLQLDRAPKQVQIHK